MKSSLFLILLLFFAITCTTNGQYSKDKKVTVKQNTIGSTALFDKNGKYLGNINKNQYDPNSISNPYGHYGSPYSSESINNPYGTYGNPYSSQSVNNPYGSSESPQIYDREGNYLGRVNKNIYDSESISNPYGVYGSPYSSQSINNPYGKYGNPYSTNSATNPFGTGSIFKINPKKK